jgi:hypothetical protein
VEELHAQIREHLGREACGFGFRGLHLRTVAFVDRGAHHEGLAPFRDLLAHDVVRVRPLELGSHGAGLDRLSSGGELAEDHDVEIAVVGERERPRDGGRGHDQDVDVAAAFALPLVLESHPLMQAESVLLVDDGEREIGERHALLHERVRADQEIHRSGGDGCDDPGPVLAGHGPRQRCVRQRRSHLRIGGVAGAVEQRMLIVCARDGRRQERSRADRIEQRSHRAHVLAGEDLGGRHDRGLVPGSDRDQARVQGDERLAGTDVALQEQVHRRRATHRRPDLLHRPKLRLRRLERHRVEQRLRERRLRLVPHALGLRRQPPLAKAHAELEDEQLVELQARARVVQLAVVGREVDVADRGVEIRKSFHREDLRGHRIRHRRDLLERTVHELTDRPRRDAVGGGMHRRDPAHVNEVAFVPAEDLDLLVRELQLPPVSRGDARHRELGAAAVHRRDPRLVEERELEDAGRVGERDGHHGLAAAREALLHRTHRADHGDVFADA